MLSNCILRGLGALTLPVLLSACIEKEEVVHIGDAENILITSDQRLLVSGGDNIYEVDGEPGNYSREPLFKGHEKLGQYACNFTGIAEYGDWLFTSCVSTKFLIIKNNHLLAARRGAGDLEFELITHPTDINDPYDRLVLPNGIAFGGDGALLVADYNLFGASGIARIELDYSQEKPRIQSLEKNFVSPAIHGISSPNGIRVDGDYLYVSDANSVKRFSFDANHQVPEYTQDANGQTVPNGSLIWNGGLAIVDDIMPYCNGIAFTSYLSGRLHYAASALDSSGQEHFPLLYSSPPLAFESPSALAFGEVRDLFGTDQLLVTEKGLLGELESENGNRLVVAPLTMDLAHPQACNEIADLALEAIGEL